MFFQPCCIGTIAAFTRALYACLTGRMISPLCGARRDQLLHPARGKTRACVGLRYRTVRRGALPRSMYFLPICIMTTFSDCLTAARYRLRRACVSISAVPMRRIFKSLWIFYAHRFGRFRSISEKLLLWTADRSCA